MAVENGWGQGAINNTNDYGKAKANSTNGFGKIYESTNAGLTNIVGGDPVVSISYAFNSFCADASDPTPTVSNNAGAGAFSSTTGLVINSTTGVIDIDASTASTYTVTYTDTDAATAIFDLTIHALPTVTVSVSAGTICVGESTTITASGASSYSWSNGSTGNSITVSPTTTTTFTATGTDSNGCTNTGATTITVNALPSVSISGTLTYCAGSTTTLTATAGLSSYLWSTGATTQAINVTAGSYTVTGTDSNGCSATSSASAVTELPLDSATVTYSASAYCQVPTGATAVEGYYPLYTTESAAQAESSDGTAHAHTLSGTTYYMPNDGVTIYHGTYSLTTPAPTITGETGAFSESTGNLTIDSSTGVITLNSSTTGTYTVVYTTNGTCPNTVNNTVTINALDGATFGYSASSLPQTGTASLTTTPTTSGGVYSAYPSGLSINSSTGEIDLAASTIQSYKIFYETSGAGCPNSSTFDLSVTASGLSNTYSISFDGIDDYIDAGNISALNGATQATWSCWYKRTGGGSTHFMGTWGGASARLFLPYQFSSGMAVYMGNSTGTSKTMFQNNSCGISQNTWHHFAFVYNEAESSNADKLKFYLDGTQIANTVAGSALTSLNTVTNSFNIGAPFTSAFLTGNLDEIAIWNKALTSTQVQSIYNATSSGLTKDLSTIESSNLKHWWRMGDGDTYPTITDNAGNNDGTMTNMSSTDIVSDTPT